jgi:hypothetical protein
VKVHSNQNPIASGAKELAEEIVGVLKRKVSGISEKSQHNYEEETIFSLR